MNLKSNYKDRDISSYLVELEISAEDLDSQFQKLLTKYSATLNLPGFRKGKVPPGMVEKKFGGELSQAVLEEVIPKAIEETIKTHALESIGPAELEKDHPPLKYLKGQPLNLKLILNKKPSCKIKTFEGLTITKNKYQVNDKDVDENRKRILESLGKSIEIDTLPQSGDMVHLDLEFQNQELKDLSLKSHIAMFDEKGKDIYPPYLVPLYKIIKEMKKGDSQEIDFNFPSDMAEERLKGKSQPLSLKINRITRFQPAELNQETLDRLQIKNDADLMSKIKKDMEDHAREQAERQAYDEAILALKKNTVFKIPEIAIDYFLQSSWNQLAEELKMRGQKNVPEAPPEAWLKENRDQAREKIETDLLITQVREEKDIQVGEEELENKIKEMADASKMDLKDYRRDLIKSGGFTELKRQMGHRKTLDWILAQCKVVEEKEFSFSKLNELRKQSQ